MDDLVIYVRLTVRPECIDEWLVAVREIIERMSAEPEFVVCHLHRDAQTPNVFTLYERWREPSVEAFLRNQAKPYRAAYEAKLPRLLEKPREPQLLAPIASWPR